MSTRLDSVGALVPPGQGGILQSLVLAAGGRLGLLENPDLHSEVWSKLWKGALAADAMILLKSPVPTPGLLLQAARTTKRVGDLELLVQHNVLDLETSKVVLSHHRMRSTVADHWLMGTIHPDVLEDVLEVASPMSSVQHLRRTSPLLSDEVALKRLLGAPDTTPLTRQDTWRNTLVRVASAVLSDHPEILGDVLASGRFTHSVAACRHLGPTHLAEIGRLDPSVLLGLLPVLVENMVVPRNFIREIAESLRSCREALTSYGAYTLSRVEQDIQRQPDHLEAPHERLQTVAQVELALSTLKAALWLPYWDLEALLRAPLDQEAGELLLKKLSLQHIPVSDSTQKAVDLLSERLGVSVGWPGIHQALLPMTPAEEAAVMGERLSSAEVGVLLEGCPTPSMFEVALALLATFDGTCQELCEAVQLVTR